MIGEAGVVREGGKGAARNAQESAGRLNPHGSQVGGRGHAEQLLEAPVEVHRGKSGQPDKSEFVKRIFSTDKEKQMPPPNSHRTLTAAQRDLLKRWIAEGAELIHGASCFLFAWDGGGT